MQDSRNRNKLTLKEAFFSLLSDTSCIWYFASGILHLASGIWHLVSCIFFLFLKPNASPNSLLRYSRLHLVAFN